MRNNGSINELVKEEKLLDKRLKRNGTLIKDDYDRFSLIKRILGLETR